MSYNDFIAGYQGWKEEEDRKNGQGTLNDRSTQSSSGRSANGYQAFLSEYRRDMGLPEPQTARNPYAEALAPRSSAPSSVPAATVPQQEPQTLAQKTEQAKAGAQYSDSWLEDLFGRYGTEAGESLAKGADAVSRMVQKDASWGERAEAGFDLVKTGLEAGLKGATGGVTNLLDALTGREDAKETAAAQLAAGTTVDEYLGQNLTGVQQQAAIDLLNRYKAANPEIWNADLEDLPEAQRAELAKYRQLDKQLGWMAQTADRLDKGARAVWNNLAATPDVLLETGKAAALNLADNLRNEDWLAALGDAWAGAGYDDVQAMTDEEVRQDAARRAEVAQQLQETGADRTMDLDTEGAQRMQRAAELQQQAKQGLSGGAALGYDVGMAVADNLVTLPLAAIPGVGGGLVLGVQGAKAAAQEANDLARRGISADEALLRGAVSGGIEAATEKIGLDNILDIVGKGGKAALNSLFKDGLQQLAKEGSSSAVGRAVAGVLSNMSAEALEETASYVANYAAAEAFEDPEASFSVEELAYSALIGGLSGGVLGGGASVVNAITGRGNTAGAQVDQQQSIPGAVPAEAGVPTTAPQSVAGTGVDLTQLYPGAQQPAAEQRNQGEAGNGFDIRQLYPEAGSETVNTDNTAVDDNPETHTADELARIEEYKKAADPGLANFYEAVLNGEYDGVPYTVGMVNDRAAQAIQDLTGMDVRGNAHVLDDNGVHHIENRHGAAGEADSTMAEVEDVSRARYVLDNFDEAYLSKDKAYGYSTKQGKRAPVVVFSKKIDGSHVVVEAACDGKKNRCYIITEYIAKNGVDAKEMAKSWHPLDVHKSAAQDTSETQTPVTSPSPVYHAGAETVNEFDIRQLYPGAESETVNTDNTAVDDNPETHTADELARIEEYKKAADPGLANFYEAVLNGEYDGVPYTVGMVNDRAAQAIQDLTGMDVRGNAHVLDDNGVHHIENRHGAAGEADSTMAEVEDVSRARYVLDNFDEAYLSKDKAYGYSTKQGKRAPVVVFSKKIDGSHVVVEAACDGKKNRCYIITEYIAKNGVDAKEMAKSWHPLDVHKSAAQDTSETQTPVTSPSPVYHAGAETVNEFDIRQPSPDVEQLSSPASSGILASENTEASASEASPASELSALLTAEETAPALERTAKSQSIQSRQESQFVRELGDLFGIPEGESRARLRQLATQLADQRRTTGRIDPALADSIFEEAYQQGRVIEEQFYNDYKGLKDEMRTTAVTLDSESRNAAEYGDLRRSAMGRVLIVNEGGTPVDVRYAELSERYPSLFPDDIINPLEQLQQMVDVAASIRRHETNLDSYLGEDAEIFRQDARLRFDEAVNELTDGVDKVRRLEEDTARQTAAKNPHMPEPMSVEEISRIEEEAARLTRKADRIMSRTALTEGDKALLQSLLDGKTRVEDLKPSTPNLQDILKVYEARKAARDVRAPITAYHAQVRQARAARVQKMLEGTEQWADKSGFLSGLRYSTETMERNVRDISRRSGEAGARAAEAVTGMFEAVHKNEAASTKWKNQWREQIAALNLNQAESEHVQLLGELRGLQAAEEMGLARTTAEIEAVTQAESQHLEQYRDQMNMDKVERAVSVFREAYDSIFQQMNEAYIKNGYKPMEYRQGYFPHFTQTQPDGLLRVVASKLGISVESDSLPTDIAGLTYQFRPGRRWNPAALTRQGYETTYDAVKGFDRYLEVAADVIHHTEDIQTLRSLEDGIRYKYGDEGLRQQMDAIRADETLTDEQRDARMEELRGLGKSHLSNFVQEVNEYTNLLAGKKSHFDRMIEKDMGRSIYQTMNNMENRVAANMVAINPGSWLTNFIPIMQSVGETSPRSLLQAGYDTIRSMVQDDGFADQSVFLTNRRGSEPLSMTGLQRLSRTLASPMQIIDDFTSNVVTRAKYMDNVRAGMDQVSALENADRYAANLMADRSKGALPTVFGRKNPLTRLLTMYQVEVNNQLRYLGKDLPDELKEEGAKAIAAALLKIAVASYLFNDLYELVVGRRSALDPIDIVNEAVGDTLGLQLPNTFEEAGRLASGTASAQDFQADQAGAIQALASTGENVLEQVPFVGGLLGGGRIPISSALPDVGTVGSSMAGLISGETNSKKALNSIGKELAKPAAYLLPPFGGGQVKKMIEGASTIIGGGSYSLNSDGEKQLQFAVEDPTAGDWLTALTFGKWALPGGREYLQNFSRESTGYTQAYEAGYGTDILDQLYPGSGKGAGEVSYSTMLPDQEGAEQVDSWLEKLYGSTDNKSVLPSNSTTSFTVDGEKVDLSGPEALEYAQNRQTVGYEILSLFKEPESRPLDVQEQYAVYAQDYAAEVAKAEATGIPPKETSWVAKVQQLAGVSGTDVTDDLIDVLTARAIIATTKGRKQPNGKDISGSRRRNVLEALRAEGYTTDEAIRLYEALT